ncbi:MAG: hypothetical protein RR884_09560 [Acinetobacter sp.]
MKIYKIRYSSSFSNTASTFVEQVKVNSINRKIKSSFNRSGKATFEIEFSDTSDRQWNNVARFARLKSLN